MYRKVNRGARVFRNPEGSKESEGELILQGIQGSDGGKILKYTGHDVISTYDIISTRDPV